ncbi:MAG: hypothetical protein GX786_02900, partial [Clostridiales bacterium]|nr:hypothetical protein [Clostridiales bacterium]
MKKKLFGGLLFFVLSLLLFLSTAVGEIIPATSEHFSLPIEKNQAKRLCDQDYSTYWKSKKKDPSLEIHSPQPLGGLYLCFANPPQPWVAQQRQGENWVSVYEGGKEGFLHEYFPLKG